MDSVKLLTLLRHSINTKSLRLGILIHQKVVISGFQNNISLCKNLISLYLCRQLFGSAKLVCKSVHNPVGISLWNCLLAGYTKNSMFTEAIHLFKELSCFSYLKPDSYSYPSVLKACGGLGKGYIGEMIHTQVTKIGFLSDIVVGSSVVAMYAKCNMFQLAMRVFDEMPIRDVGCWNTVMSCYYQNGQSRKALELFEKMKALGFEPDSVTLTTAIASCARLLDLENGKRVHKEWIEMGIPLDAFICTALVDMYGKCGCLEMALELFNKIPNKTLVSWNSIIAGYSVAGDSSCCIGFFRRMREERMEPTSTTLSSLLMACSRSANLQHGKFVHGFLIRNYVERDIYISSSLLDLYFKCGSVSSAERVFDKMLKLNVVTWNVMMSGYVFAGCYFEALRIFADMVRLGVKPDSITFISTLTACSQLAALEKGKEIHEKIMESKLESDEILMAALLDMYSKCGAVNEARNIFDKLPEKDIVSWTSMITAYGSHGQASQALDLFHKMLRSNIKPDRVTFLAVISACSHAGLVDKGCYYFNSMRTDFGIEPTLEVYSCLIDLLARARRLQEAYRILKNMNYNIRDDDKFGLLSSLFSACHLHGESELGEELARFVVENNPNDQSAHVVLANMYSSGKRWDEAGKVRWKMKELGLKKKPGCSWIEIGKKIQPFFVEHIAHPEAQLVYDCLESLALHMEKKRMDES